jgi:hypothetical protein
MFLSLDKIKRFMPITPEPANDDAPIGQTVSQQVLEAFYMALGTNPELAEIAQRLRSAGHSEKDVREALFGEAATDD